MSELPTLKVLYGARTVALYALRSGDKPTKKNLMLELPRDPKNKTDDANVIFVNSIANGPRLHAELKQAVKCVGWCREHHDQGPQGGAGIPVEAIWQDVISAAEGRG